MMKIFPANRINGVVYADGGAVLSCPVLGDGANSEGWLIIAEGELVYIPKATPDTAKTLELISTALATIASGVYQANMGGDITSPTFSTDLAEIKKQVDELRGNLK